jgi:isocitrate dehydrogenase kinase/phosphatase
MEHTDWIHQGFDAAQARFLMVTAITHHRFSSPIWGEQEVRKLRGELEEIEVVAAWVAPRPATVRQQ